MSDWKSQAYDLLSMHKSGVRFQPSSTIRCFCLLGSAHHGTSLIIMEVLVSWNGKVIAIATNLLFGDDDCL